MTILDGGVAVVIPKTHYADNRHGSQNTAGFTTTHEYTNYSKRTLYLKTQGNLPIVLTPSTLAVSGRETREHVEVKTTHRIRGATSIVETYELINALKNNDIILSAEAESMGNKLMQLFASDASRANKINFEFVTFKVVTLEPFANTKTLYFRDTDIILSEDKALIQTPHPNSNEGLQQTDVMSNARYYGQAGVFIKVVDNHALTKVRYYYAGKQLITVPSSVDPAQESGVYCTISTMDRDGMVTPTTFFLTFKEAEERIGLYRFQDEALSHGNPELIVKAKEAKSREVEARVRVEEKELSAELAREKHYAELRALKFDEELTKYKLDLEMQRNETVRLKDAIDTVRLQREEIYDSRKKERDDYYDRSDRRRKDHFEERSHKRKDTTEVMKFLPALLLGIAGTFAFMRGSKT